jgi:glycosyltransferase involved in cell wall biosynthesis
MRVLYVGHTYSIKANQDKIAALTARPDMEVLLLTPDRWIGPLYSHKTDVYVGPKTQHKALRSLFIGKESLYVFATRLKESIEKFQPDIVHVEQGTYAAVFAQVLHLCYKVSPNAKATFFTWWNLPTPVRGIKKVLEQYNLKRSACAIAGNADAARLLKERGFSRPIHIMPQIGVNLEDYRNPVDHELKRSLGLSGFVVGYIGRLAEEKGVTDLIDAMKQAPKEWTLLTVGAGPLQAEIAGARNTGSIRNVHVTSVRNEDIPRYLKLLDVLVLPSRQTPEWMEQFGHILIEAMAAGVPVIGASTGEIPNVIGDAGIIVRPEAPQEILNALKDLDAQPDHRHSLAQRGRERVEALYTHDQIARQQIEVYEWMIREGKSIGELSRS